MFVMGLPPAELHSLRSPKSSLHMHSADSDTMETMDHVVIPNIGTDEPLFEVIPKLSR
jgi:hypothetical protein